MPSEKSSNNSLTDESVSKLAGCHASYLSETKITDESVCKLAGCHTLGLSYTKITDESVCKLGRCHPQKPLISLGLFKHGCPVDLTIPKHFFG